MIRNIEKIETPRLVRLIRTILRRFDAAGRGDPFGWDFPTMRVIFPRLTAAYRELINEYSRRAA